MEHEPSFVSLGRIGGEGFMAGATRAYNQCGNEMASGEASTRDDFVSVLGHAGAMLVPPNLTRLAVNLPAEDCQSGWALSPALG